jgi:four helix bundle protein
MVYDLEVRCEQFAMEVRNFCRVLKHDTINLVYIKQIIRSSSSIGANYIEANENLGKQDQKLKLRISRKEAKETKYWMKLLITDDENTRMKLYQEADELRRILSAILNKLPL